MNYSYQHSFISALFFAVFFFVAIPVPVTALPTTLRRSYHDRRQQSSSSSTALSPNSGNDGTQTIETVQVFTMFGGNATETCTLVNTPITLPNGDGAVVFEKYCSFSFTPSSNPANTPASVSPTTSSNALVTTIVTSKPASMSAVSLSMFTTDGPPPSPTSIANGVSANTTTTTTPTTKPSITSDTPADDTGVSVVPTASVSSGPPAANGSAAASSDPFTSMTQSHLSSLPIFLGAFGGIAGLALLVVGFKVYKPVQRFNEMRLNPPGFMRHLKGCGGRKWWHVRELEGEKRKGKSRLGAERDGQIDSQISGWIS